MYDAIEVGARCAGSRTAMLLARAGHRVLLVDRAGFPSDTILHALHPPARRGAAAAVGPARPRGRDRLPAGAPHQILLEAAAAAGAEVRERFSVSDVLIEDGRVTGIRGREAGGATVTERAAIVIGADGMRSRVARAVGAPTYGERPGRTCAY